MNGKAIVAAALLLGALGPRAWALSMRNSAAEAVLDGLSPGTSYRLESSPAALAVTNTGREDVSVDVELAPPGPGELKDGYEPMPASWAKLVSKRLSLAAGKTGPVAGVLSLPSGAGDGPGQYQLQWRTRGQTSDGTWLRLVSRLLVRVGDEERIRRERGRMREAPGEIEVVTRDRSADGAPLGKAVPLAGLNAALKLVNAGERAARVALRPVDADDAVGRTPDGYSPTPNPRFVRAAEPVIDVPPGKVVEAPLILEIPDEPRYRGRRWVFAVAVTPIGAGEAPTQYFRLLVSTSKEAGRR